MSKFYDIEPDLSGIVNFVMPWLKSLSILSGLCASSMLRIIP
jgi:hypothetical protein